jgi:hypothetical protein
MATLVQASSLLVLCFLGRLASALPAADTTPVTGSIRTSVDSSEYAWISSWASDTTGLDPTVDNTYNPATQTAGSQA